MYHARMFTKCSDPATLAEIESMVIQVVDNCYIYAATNIGRATGWRPSQVFEFDCTSPMVATELAEEACRIGGLGVVEVTIDGRLFECVGTGEPAKSIDR